jgi:hypothetical protein
MKLEQSKIRVDVFKDKSGLLEFEKPETTPKVKAAKPSIADDPVPELNVGDMPEKPRKSFSMPATVPASPIRDDYSTLREAALSVQRIKASAQQELEQIRRMRADAVRYQMETATKARSEANQLVLRTRLATQREVEELIRQASEEIQKMLADIRVIRITAQEELSAQRKFTDAAKLNSLSLSMKEEFEKATTRPRKQPAATR